STSNSNGLVHAYANIQANTHDAMLLDPNEKSLRLLAHYLYFEREPEEGRDGNHGEDGEHFFATALVSEVQLETTVCHVVSSIIARTAFNRTTPRSFGTSGEA
ncbi:unnamed protein product, partial [Amoebophrya sp. A25]